MSYHLTILERLRAFVELPSVGGKYTNAWLIAHIIAPSLEDVWARVNLTMDDPVFARLSIDFKKNQEYYIMPPTALNVHAIMELDENNNVIRQWFPYGFNNPKGQGWSMEGNEFRLQPLPLADKTMEVFYVPNGNILTHYSTGGDLDAGGTVLTLGDPLYGQLDRRPNAYVGQILRLLPESGKVEERVIKEHDVCAGTVTVRTPFTGFCESSSSGTGVDVPYEIAPLGSQSLYEAIAVRSAIKLGPGLRLPGPQMKALQVEYQMAMKTIGDNLSFKQMRTPGHIDKLTDANPDYWMWRLTGI